MSVQRRPKQGKPKTGAVKWVVRYRDPAGKEHSKSFPTEKAAKDFDADQATKLARGLWIDPSDEKTTLGQLVDEWVDQALTEGTRGVRDGFRANLGNLKDMPIGMIRPSHITEWATALRRGRPWRDGKPLADITVELHLGRLKGILGRAAEDGMIARSPIPASLRKTVMTDKKINARQVPTVDQVRLMCQTATTGGTPLTPLRRMNLAPSPWLALAIRLGVDTGLRVGEIAGLTWSDIDLSARTVRVEKQCGKNLGVYGPLKTKRARRSVPLSTPMARELQGWVGGDNDPVIPGPTGKGTSSHSLTRDMRLLGAVMGLEDHLHRFHGLRHLYASSLLAAGEPITTVAALLGDSVQTTSKVYAHWLPGAQEAARSSINSLAGLVRDDVPVLRVVE